MSIIRFFLPCLFKQPKPGQVWAQRGGDPFTDSRITITDVRGGWCQYYLTHYGSENAIRHSKEVKSLISFWKQIK